MSNTRLSSLYKYTRAHGESIEWEMSLAIHKNSPYNLLEHRACSMVRSGKVAGFSTGVWRTKGHDGMLREDL